MPIVKSNFSTYQSINTAFTELKDIVSLEVAYSWGAAALGNIEISDSDTVNSATNSQISLSTNVGDSVLYTGTNLLGYPLTLSEVNYTFNNENIEVNFKGERYVASESENATGNFDEFRFESPEYGSAYIELYEDSITYDYHFQRIQGASFGIGPEHGIAIVGDITQTSTSTFEQSTQIWNTEFSGYIEELILKKDNQEIYLVFDPYDYQAFEAIRSQADSIDAFLSTFLSDTDIVAGDVGNDYLSGYGGDDLLLGDLGDDVIDGGLGDDKAFFDTESTLVTGFSIDGNTVTIVSPEGTDMLKNVEIFEFNDIQLSISELQTKFGNLPPAITTPVFSVTRKDGSVQQVTAERYEGAVEFLEYQLLGDAEGNVVIGSSGNDFINLLDGDDAANGGDGQDVLDGGLGSNFLTGGSGADIFFLDGRSGSTTWSTITDFNGDSVNIWGWQEGTSRLLLTQENAGAEGFKGVTHHYDLNNDGQIDTSITFSELNAQQVPMSIVQEIAGNGYLLFG